MRKSLKYLRRLADGLLTVSGVQRRGFFIPYRHARHLPQFGGNPPYRAFESWLRGLEPQFAEILQKIESYSDNLMNFNGHDGQPRWDQELFHPLDGAAAYTFIRLLRPRTIIEVGSGHSTRFMAQALQDEGLETTFVTIDPGVKAQQRVGFDGRIVKRRTVLQAVELELFAELKAGDVLFIDSSHIAMPGSDVDFVMARIVPILPAGVILHFHDIFLPDDYPAIWPDCGQNEQLAVAALLAGGAFEVLFASHYVRTRMGQQLQNSLLDRLPERMRHLESSLWLRKSGPALSADNP